MTYGGTASSTGFELQPYDRESRMRPPGLTSYSRARNGDSHSRRPTSAVRPRLGSQQRLEAIRRRIWMEQEDAVRTAIQKGVPLLLRGRHRAGLGCSRLLRSRLYDNEVRSSKRKIVNDSIVERRWLGPGSAQLRMFEFIIDREQISILTKSSICGGSLAIRLFSSDFKYSQKAAIRWPRSLLNSSEMYRQLCCTSIGSPRVCVDIIFEKRLATMTRRCRAPVRRTLTLLPRPHRAATSRGPSRS